MTFRTLSRRRLFLALQLNLLLAAWLALAGQATATIIDWAGHLAAGATQPLAANAVGPPNGISVPGVVFSSATYDRFGVPAANRVDYSPTAQLANLLGVSIATLDAADFIAFEVNGTPGGSFESSAWTFSDGTNSLALNFVSNSAPAGPVIAHGIVTNTDYRTFFGLPSNSFFGDWPFILFDVGGNSAVNVRHSLFNATVTSTGDDVFGTPDIDALGRMVPEPVSAALACCGAVLFGSVMLHRRRGLCRGRKSLRQLP